MCGHLSALAVKFLLTREKGTRRNSLPKEADDEWPLELRKVRSMAGGRKVQWRINVHVYNFPSFSDKAEAAMR